MPHLKTFQEKDAVVGKSLGFFARIGNQMYGASPAASEPAFTIEKLNGEEFFFSVYSSAKKR